MNVYLISVISKIPRSMFTRKKTVILRYVDPQYKHVCINNWLSTPGRNYMGDKSILKFLYYSQLQHIFFHNCEYECQEIIIFKNMSGRRSRFKKFLVLMPDYYNKRNFFQFVKMLFYNKILALVKLSIIRGKLFKHKRIFWEIYNNDVL